MILLWIVVAVATLCGLTAVGCVIGDGRIESMREDDQGEPERGKIK